MEMLSVLLDICMFFCNVLSVVAAGDDGAQRGFSVLFCFFLRLVDNYCCNYIITLHVQGHQRSIHTTCYTKGLQNHVCSCEGEILLQSLCLLRKVSLSGGSYRKKYCKRKKTTDSKR